MPVTVVVYAGFIIIIFSILISVTALVNLCLDLKRGAKAYLVLLLCLSLHNFVGALSALPWFILYVESSPAFCMGVIFVIRVCLMGSTTMTTMLALERLLSLVAPFWYDLHVTVRNAVVAAVVMSVAMAGLSSVTFGVNNLQKAFNVENDAIVTQCAHIPPALVSAVMAPVAVVNVALTLAFDLSFLRQLRLLNQGSSPAGQNNMRVTSPEAPALFRLVIALSVVSVVINLSTVATAVWKFVDPELTSPARMLLSALLGVGHMANSGVFLGCTARYRRRLQHCLAGALRAVRNRCCWHRVEPLEMNTSAAQGPKNHSESVPQSAPVVAGREVAVLPVDAGQDTSDAGCDVTVQTGR